MLRNTGIVLALSLCLASCFGAPKVIPRKTFQNICIDMFMADQWITNNYFARAKMDTMLVYEPIFRKYGYTSEDYDATVHYYLSYPDKYSKMMREVSVRLDKASDRYKLAQEIVDGLKNADSDRHGYTDYIFTDSTLIQHAQGKDSLRTY